jgi:hypothetical protein
VTTDLTPRTETSAPVADRFEPAMFASMLPVMAEAPFRID